MISKFKSALAVIAAMSSVLITVAPAHAVAYDRLNIVVDCDLGETGEDDHVIASGEVLTVTFVNCDGVGIIDNDNTGNATMPNSTVIDDSYSQTVSGNSFVVTVDGEADLEVDNSEDVDVYVAGTIDDPTTTLLATEDMTLRLSARETMIREEMIGDPVGDDGTGDIYMDMNEECEVEPGLHVYTTLKFDVNKAGTYDFRAIDVSPIDEDLNWGVTKYPSSDPFFALYEDFDPSSPENGLVGCNDDGDDSGITEVDEAWGPLFDSFEGLVTESGEMLHSQWPWFRTTLEPGTYTMVYMPFSTMGTEDFALGQFGATSDNNPTDNPDSVWEPTAQTVTYEMWGPAGGITLGEGLAATGGIEPSLALWAGLAIVGTGVAIGAGRRRETRV